MHTRRWFIGTAACGLALAAAVSFAQAEVPKGRIAYLAQSGSYWQVWLVAPDGTGERQVTHSEYEKTGCSWFPDGKHLLVNSLDGRLYRVSIESGEEQEISLPLAGMLDATVSPDGSAIAFSINTAGAVDNNDIWTVDPDGTNLKRLTEMPWLQNQPRWSRDGKWVYFVSGDGTQAHDIWRVSPATRSKEQLTVGRLYHFELALAPDGRMAFSSNRSGNYEIYTQGEAEEPTQRTDNPALDASPSWSPDGEALVFHSTRAGSMNIWRLDESTGTPEQITHHASGARSPEWGPAPEPGP